MKKYLAISSAVVAIAIVTALVMADVHSATYKGTSVCKMCHGMMSKELVTAFEKTAHPKAMMPPTVEGAIVADFAGNPSFTKDKVAYVLGKGQREQAYMDANFKVLPAKWNVQSKTWKPQTAADGATQCVGCHSTGFDPATKVCTEMGAGCESCHGPGSEHTAGNKTAIVSLKGLDKKQQSVICASCHSSGKDITGKYAFPMGYRPGDDLTKCFVDAKPTGPGMNQQYSEFIQSKLAAAGLGCTTCHDPHGKSGLQYQLVKPVNELCLMCHGNIKDIATHAPSAAADATCATCHMPGGVHFFKKPEK